MAAMLALVVPAPGQAQSAGGEAEAPPRADPRAGDPDVERSRQLFAALRDVLDEAARRRFQQKTDPESAIETFFYSQMGVDESGRIQALLGSAFELLTDSDIRALQEDIAARRRNIAELRAGVAELRERRLAAPKDSGWEGWLGLAEDHAAIDGQIAELTDRITEQDRAIAAGKKAFREALARSGAALDAEQADLLLESVTGGDLVALAAAYDAVRRVSDQLQRLMDENGEDLAFARRYYGMHTALIAIVLEAQGALIGRIDGDYLPKLDAIEGDINAAAAETRRLLRDTPTRAQRRVLEANRDSQKVAKDALGAYREILRRQRSDLAAAHRRAEKDLRVADNTLRTVDASFQLRQLMQSAADSFKALHGLQTPGFDRVFRNERLRREFRELTDRLDPPS